MKQLRRIYLQYLVRKQNNKMFSYQKTPPKKKRGDLLLLSGINKFKRSNKPVITKEDRDILQTKLTIEKQSIIATSQRLINDNLYIRYNRNPFSQIKNKKKKFSSTSFSPIRIINPEKSKKKKQAIVSTPKSENIVDELNGFKTDQNFQLKDQRRINRFQKIDVLISESKKISNNILVKLEKSKRQASTKSDVQSKKTVIQKQIIGLTDEQKNLAKKQQIDDIVTMHDTNYFFHEGRQKLNIFKCVQSDQYNLNSVQQLKQRKFSFNAIIMKVGKLDLSIERQISSISRQLQTKTNHNPRQIIDLMDNTQLAVKEKELTFNNLLSMASGRLSSQVFSYLNNEYTYNNNNQEGSDASSEQYEEQYDVIFKKNTQNYKMSYRNQNEEKYEITEFENVHLRKNQQQYQQKCKTLKDRIGKLLDQKKFSYTNRIQDIQLLKKHEEQLKATIGSYMNENKDNEKDISKMVRNNKKSKDRTGLFKLNYLVDSLKFKNNLDQKIKNGFQTSRF